MGVRRRLLACIMIVLAVLMVGCTQAKSQDPSALKGVQWTLSKSSETAEDLTKLGIMAEFDGTRLSGFSGVNSYTGAYTAEADGTFKAGPLATTMMAGPPQLMAAETLYLKLLGAAEKYEVAEKTLTLTTADGKTLTYEGAAPPDLAGSSWTVTNYNNGKEAVVGTVTGSELTLAFGTDGNVSGSGGVNTFSGPFTSAETSIKIGPLAATMMAGSEELMAQEQQYMTALQAATTWDIANGVLTLRDDKGAMQVVASQK
jgi:heat shock protein HslJ